MSNNAKIIILDELVINKYDNTAERFFSLKESEAITLLSLAKFIGWRTRWINLTKTQSELNELEASISDSLMNPLEVLIMDCNDVENCLPTSPTIIQIQTDTANNQTSITNNQTSITNLYNSAPDGNLYPASPTLSEPDLLCNASLKVTNELWSLIDETITDAQTITLQEFLSSLLNFGGWQADLLKQFWDLIISNYAIDPNLSTNAQTAIPTIHEYLYCNELNLDLTKIDIDADNSLSAQVKASYIGAIDSVTPSKVAQWVYIGSTETGADCSQFCEPSTQWVVYDLCGDYIAQAGETVITTAWTVTSGVIQNCHLTDVDNYAQAEIAQSGVTFDAWQMYANKAPAISGARLYLNVDGVNSPTSPITITDANYHWSPLTGWDVAQSPKTINTKLVVAYLRISGNISYEGGIKYIRLRLV